MADNVTFLLRGGSAEEWQTTNPVLARREPGVEVSSDGSRIKVGDGVTSWNDLPYLEGAPPEGIFAFKAEHPVAALWTINHNLGYEPAGVFVTDSGGTEWMGEVTHLSVNALTIKFNTAFGGTVRLS